jgi:hypothetical protein
MGLASDCVTVIFGRLGTSGGAVKYVFQNRKWLFSISNAIKKAF